MNKKQLARLGIPRGDAMEIALAAAERARKSGLNRGAVRRNLETVAQDPAAYQGDPVFGELAAALIAQRDPDTETETEIEQIPAVEGVPYRAWGSDFEPDALRQMENACRLPVSVAGALMPDAHVGYGLPIGGVLATENSVIPYAVGVDIACRMKMTVLDLPVRDLDDHADRLRRALGEETRFGIGASFHNRRGHRVMDEDWSVSPVTDRLKDKAWAQLGTSGSGNHFAEFGVLTLDRDDLGLAAGEYLALLSHSGSRGVGNEVASHYSRLARAARHGLPRDLVHLAWLELDTEAGREYWDTMHLMGRYASANHELIHRHIARHLGVEVLLDIENHHNFAWIENHRGREVVVHRKGATPAALGVVGIIPGSMATPGFVVRGRGNKASLDSAAHGAGRRMSRKAAKQKFNWGETNRLLKERHVTLVSAGLDEVPMAYKDIESVMAAQKDLVEIVARFDPRLVKMAPAGERPED
ncbi:RtcB family protein [Candidatus Sumerlaeota bacterium]|nr:RtcB family protein [Candidatus Sumerlaeota bacterium]